MKILLLGADGQVGWQLRQSLESIGEIKACNKSEANLEDLKQLQKLIQTYAPNIIVNAAAYTAVDKAEKEPEKASIINSTALKLITSETKKLNALLVHYSTDYVFDGKKIGSYTEEDKANPLSVYGKTKLNGENKIKESGCKYLIFRTSWVYSTRGNNFIKTIIKLAKEKDNLSIVSDQIGVPTCANYIADITAYCIKNLNNKLYGTYNLTPTGETSWHGLATFVINELNKKNINFKATTQTIKPILTEEYPLPATRPKNSKLSTDKIRKAFKIDIPTWEHHVKLMLNTYN